MEQELRLGRRRHWGKALAMGLALAPLGGLVGRLIVIGLSLIFDHGVKADALAMIMMLGTVMGTLCALLATVVVFPLLYLV